MQFVLRAVNEVGASLNAALVVMGDKLGLYRALAGAGPLSPAELAERTGTAERYVREWMNAQAAGGYAEYEPDGGHYTLPPEQTVAMTDPDSPAYLPGFFQVALGSVLDPDKLRRGANVADIGCGHGASSILMAQVFPHSTFVGCDLPRRAIETARRRAQEAGVANRVTFHIASAAACSGTDYDPVTMFDCLQDMDDPVGAARHIRETLKPDGTSMIVEPHAGDRIEDNLIVT